MPLALCLSPPYCGCSVSSTTSALRHHPLNSSWVHFVLCFSSLHFSTFMLHFCCCQCWEAPKLSAKSFPSLFSSWFPQALLIVSLLVLGKAFFCRWSGTHSISLLFSFCCSSLSVSWSESRYQWILKFFWQKIKKYLISICWGWGFLWEVVKSSQWFLNFGRLDLFGVWQGKMQGKLCTFWSWGMSSLHVPFLSIYLWENKLSINRAFSLKIYEE